MEFKELSEKKSCCFFWGGGGLSDQTYNTVFFFLARKRLEIYYVRVGDNIMEVADPGEQEFPIDKIDFHDNFNVGPYLNNDIAVIHISKG
jgi:hypothetical protein